MSDTVTPIRNGIVPEVDAAREMRDSVSNMINDYVEQYGHAPHTICVALLGSPLDGEQSSRIMSFCPTDTNTARLHACGAAALLFTRHAICD